MKTLLLTLVILGTLAFANGPVRAQPCLYSVPGPVQPTLAWDQQYIGRYDRFLCLSNWGNAAVLDQETGLVWQRAPNTGTVAWAGALGQCRIVLTGGRAGWRLPTEEELATLVDPTQSSPPLPLGHPFQGVLGGGLNGSAFWTASTFEADPIEAYDIDFQTTAGSALGGAAGKNGFQLRFWCVRGGSGTQNPQ
jgi:Protein of unknown function (DUF1566)